MEGWDNYFHILDTNTIKHKFSSEFPGIKAKRENVLL